MGAFSKLFAVGLAGVAIRGIAKSLKENSEDKERRSIPCMFTDELTEEDFYAIAHRAIKKFKKNKVSLDVCGAVVYGTVESQTGLSEWEFSIDFNDYGEITGKYWIWAENDDSLIPEHIAENMEEEIVDILEEKNDETPTFFFERELIKPVKEKESQKKIKEFTKQLLGFDKLNK